MVKNNKNLVVTIAGRKSTAIMIDSAIRENEKFSQFTGETTQEACLRALIDFYKQSKDEYVTLLLPKTIYFLAFEDTRKFWIENKIKKNGEAIDPRILALVEKLHEVAMNKNVHFIEQSTVYSPNYKKEIKMCWDILTVVNPIGLMELVPEMCF